MRGPNERMAPVEAHEGATKKMMRVLHGEAASSFGEAPPIWVMRQAGRYLPEYRATRKRAGSFLELCYNPELAAEVTLQPIRRFGFDASILFSDILVIPDAMRRGVRFEEGRGPLLEPIEPGEVEGLTVDVLDHLAPVLETVRILRRELPAETTLLGFCGAPWTVATYMVAGHGTPDQMPARLFALEHPDAMETMIDRLVEASIAYLVAQLEAGADAVKVFDSWAGVLDQDQFDRWCVEPVARIVRGVRGAVPGAKIIGFPRNAGALYEGYRERTGVDCVALDWSVPFAQAQALQREGPVQGLLDPARLIAGGQALDEGVDAIMGTMSDGPFVFNLGHGITPQTPPNNVARMIERVRSYGAQVRGYGAA